MRLSLKVGRHGYLGLFDFTNIFLLKNDLLGVIIFSTTSHV